MWEQGHISCGAKSWETKFKNLKRSYIAYIDHNKKTGRNAKKCAYYEELHNIFHGDDDITPSAVYSSRKGLVKHLSLIKEFIERKEEKEEKKLQKLQEMHNDKKTFFGQFLKVFEKSVQLR
ncbi:uncharacterized protein LOC113671225 [Pocillopora damicornis]|uniref:uncharacterized protein LOC113671225 n=1 Tax=Pocillopora damicornis TaxID=46731 RepID=UPI000F558623|nr:uncharacterized protein LOC113671225 [Pocillopora damicornis]